ncbi:MAG: HDIG domain-containing protein, partial [Fimbriimonadaceae bacterium]|nr:HDIG domain-containing protein [Fimbriimonadaceae bacterium]
ADMKSRIIGREGRNIRTFTQITGVDLLVDESDERVTLSSFDPIRRERARLVLLNLMADGRIHPGRIEELWHSSESMLDEAAHEAGKQATNRVGVAIPSDDVLTQLGRLQFRVSMNQNVFNHSVEVAQLCSMIAGELGLDTRTATLAGLLHDIGKAIPDANKTHALAGADFLESNGFVPEVVNAVAAHHREVAATSPYAHLVIAADALSASRPGARQEKPGRFSERLESLEEIAMGFQGVDRAFALQAGRELRVFVRPEEMNDEACQRLAHQIARVLRQRQTNSKPMRVTVVREAHFSESVG